MMWHIQLVFSWCFPVIQQLMRKQMIRDRKAEEDAKIIKPWRLWPVLELKMVMSQENTSRGTVHNKLICSRCIQGSNFFSQYFHTPARVKSLSFTTWYELFSSVGQTVIWRNRLSSEEMQWTILKWLYTKPCSLQHITSGNQKVPKSCGYLSIKSPIGTILPQDMTLKQW